MVEKEQLLQVIYAAWLGTLSFIGVRLLKTLDSRAGREELANALEIMNERDERDTVARDRIFKKLDDLKDEIGETRRAVARLEGRQ
jgi:hypothetical protein